MVDIPTTEPAAFVRGDTVKWTKTLSDFPASTWTLTYEFRGPSSKQVVASADGDDHSVSITPAQSTTWNDGTYWYEGYADDGTDRYMAVSGSLEVTANLADADKVADYRTHAKKVLDAIEAVIENRATKDQQAYTIAGRSLQLTPLADLIMLRKEYRAEVLSEAPTGTKKRILARI